MSAAGNFSLITSVNCWQNFSLLRCAMIMRPPLYPAFRTSSTAATRAFLVPLAFWRSSRVPVSLASPTMRILRRPTTAPISLLRRPFLTRLSTLANTKRSFVFFLVVGDGFHYLLKRKPFFDKVVQFFDNQIDLATSRKAINDMDICCWMFF